MAVLYYSSLSFVKVRSHVTFSFVGKNYHHVKSEANINTENAVLIHCLGFGSFTLPETDSGTDSDSDSCPVQK